MSTTSRKSLFLPNPSSSEWKEDESTDFGFDAYDQQSCCMDDSNASQQHLQQSKIQRSSMRTSKIRKDHQRVQKIRRQMRILRTRSMELKSKRDRQSQEELQVLSSMEGVLEDMKYAGIRRSNSSGSV